MPHLEIENRARGRGHVRIAGVDEAGRGPWAGPVAAAAVVFDPASAPAALIATVQDSKRLSRARRETLAGALAAAPGVAVGLGWASAAEVDSLNVLKATLLAMARAVALLAEPPDYALIDGPHAPPLACPAEAVVGGDGISASIAAASIVAKVARDRAMAALAARFPGYGFERNAGYGTAEHRVALARLGPCPEHRRSFRPVLNILRPNGLPDPRSSSGPEPVTR
jgi:ribonuclease HII